MPSADFDYKFSFRIDGNQEVVASFQAITGLLDEVKTKTVEVRDTTTDSFGRLVKGSFRAEDAIKGTSDAIRTQAQVVKNLKAQNDAIIEQAKRRGALTKTEETLLRRNTEQIDRYADSLLVQTARMDKSSESFVEANILFRDIQRNARGVEQAIEMYGDEAVTAAYAQELFNDAMQAFKSDGQIVINEMRILAREMEGGKISVQAGTQAWDMYQQKLQEIISELRTFTQTQDLSADEMARATSVLANLTDAAGNAQRGFAGTRGTMLGMNKVASGANQIMLSFGDIIQDSAQFSFGFAQGARAIGNNIAFAAEQFVIMQANMKASQGQAVTFGATMSALGKSLFGPIGVIIGLNTIITAITMYSQRQERLKRETDQLASTVFPKLEASIRSFSSITGMKYIDVLEEIDKRLKDNVISTNTLINTNQRQQQVQSFNLSQQELYVAASDNTLVATNQNIIANKTLYELDKQISNELKEKIKELRNEAKLTQELIDLLEEIDPSFKTYNENVESLNELKTRSNSLLLEETTGLELSKDTREGLISQIRTEMAAVSLLNIEAAERNRLLRELQSLIDSLTSDQEQATVETEAEKALSRIKNIVDLFKTEKLDEKIGIDLIGLKAKDAEEQLKALTDTIDFTKLSVSETAEVVESLVSALSLVQDKVKDSAISFSDGFSMIASGVSNFIGSLTSLNQANADQSEEAARRQFETQKKLSYASSVVAGAEAFVKALDEKPPFNFILAGLIAASTAAQLATISKQQFNYGGGTSSGGGSSFGFKMNKIEGPQTFRTPGYTPTNTNIPAKTSVDVKIMADRKQLYAMVKQGEEEYRQIKV